MISLALAGICAWRARAVSRRDPRDLAVAAWALAVIWFVAWAVMEVIAYFAPQDLIALALAVTLAPPFSVIAPGGLLVAAALGPRRRKRGPGATALLVLLGIGLIAAPFLALSLAATHHRAGMAVAGAIFAGCAALGVWFLVFAIYSLWWLRRPPRPDPGAVIVLGAGLVRGGIGPLLAARLDAARLAWSALPPGTPVVTSGGQGPDEPRPEGDAMAEYLIAHGIPSGAVLPETASTTTRENLSCSAEILAAEEVNGHLLIVTSTFHAPRAALLSRRLGLDADAAGAPTPWPALPAALLREFAAVVVMDRRFHALLLIPIGLATAALIVLLAIGTF